MAYTAVPTATTGYLWTAADHNTYIKDNFAAGVPDIFTTKGDIAIATAADTAARLGVGSNGTILTADSDTGGGEMGVKWSGLVPSTGARYKLATDQAIANNTLTVVNYETVVFDPDSAVTAGAAWIYTVPTTGYYLVCASALFESNAGWAVNEKAEISVYCDSAVDGILDSIYMITAGTYNVFVGGTKVVYATATQTLDIRILQNSGGAINIDGDNSTNNHVAIARLW